MLPCGEISLRTGEFTMARKKLKASDIIKFGSYPTSVVGFKKYLTEPIEWIVLKVEGDKALLLSKHALECEWYYRMPFGRATWADSSLRKWLNGEFKNAAFDESERERLVTTTVCAHKNPQYSTDCGSDTEDEIFILSATEALEYFESDADRVCYPTQYAESKGASDYGCWYWLRTCGKDKGGAVCVTPKGELYMQGYMLNFSHAVRPAVWVKI